MAKFCFKCTYILLLFLILGLSCKGQYVFKVKTPLSLDVYYNVPNPIEIAMFEYSEDELRLIPVNGILDTIKGTIRWTPFFGESNLLVSLKEKGKWHIVDTIDTRIRVINPEEFSVRINPTAFHSGLPDMKRFKELEGYLPNYKYAHLDINALVRITSFEVNIYDDSDSLIKTVVFNSNMLEDDKKKALNKIRASNLNKEVIQFTNILFECRCWSSEGEWRPAQIEKELWIINQEPVIKPPVSQ